MNVDVVLLNKDMMEECHRPKEARLWYTAGYPEFNGYVVLRLTEHLVSSYVVQDIGSHTLFALRGQLQCSLLLSDGTEKLETRTFVGSIDPGTFLFVRTVALHRYIDILYIQAYKEIVRKHRLCSLCVL